jgi:phenylalanyl-tRNA synthetase alpha chain
MIEKIKKYKDDFKNRISGIGIGDELRQLRTDFLGKKGLVTQVMKDMRELSSEQKREVGRHVNELKNWIENEIKEKTEKLKGSSTEGADRTLDITLPGRKEARGSLHPITHVMDELIAIFMSLGFQVAEGPEVESDYYNFEALNIPKDHPARDMQDTFYIGGEKVLRTHTSANPRHGKTTTSTPHYCARQGVPL